MAGSAWNFGLFFLRAAVASRRAVFGAVFRAVFASTGDDAAQSRAMVGAIGAEPLACVEVEAGGGSDGSGATRRVECLAIDTPV